jgi:hypothetical protein
MKIQMLSVEKSVEQTVLKAIDSQVTRVPQAKPGGSSDYIKQ